MVARTVGGAGYGTRDWLVQRASAVYMLLFCLVALIYLLIEPPTGYQQWQSLMKLNSVRIASLMFWLALSIHAWIGMRNVLMDYVKHTGFRVLLHACVLLALLALFFWMVQILWDL